MTARSILSRMFGISRRASGSRRSSDGLLQTRLALETLESRELLAANITATLDHADGVLRIEGTENADKIQITHFSMYSMVQGASITVIDGASSYSTTFLRDSEINWILVNGLGGDDTITINSAAPAMVFGENGNDTITGGSNRDTLYGGEGDDVLFGNYGNDYLIGDGGNDFLFGDSGDDSLYGGAGNDIMHGDNYTIGVTGNDYLEGDEGHDEMRGGEGSDTLYGGASIDFLWGGAGNDWLYGQDDYDMMYGEAGSDYLDGGEGVDDMWGGTENDWLYGGDGDDRMYGQEGNDTLNGLMGNDLLYGDAPGMPDNLCGNDFIDGYYGNDTIYAGAGSDTVYGGQGEDQIYGQEGIDYYHGDEGNDYLWDSGGTADWYDGGDGSDYIAESSASVGNDTVYGGAGNDQIYTSWGDDLIYGQDGNDTISAGTGNDTVYGGNGNDYIVGGPNVAFMSGTDRDYLDGGAGDDHIEGGPNPEGIGSFGSDYIYGRAGNDTLYGGNGVDYMQGGDDNDVMYGYAGDDWMSGGNGDDLMYPGLGNDNAYGNAGRNQIVDTPEITGLSTKIGYAPVAMQEGSWVTIYGAGFVSGSKVQFGGYYNQARAGLQATRVIYSADGKSITAQVPRGAMSGLLQVITPSGQWMASPEQFQVVTYRNTYGFQFCNFGFNVSVPLVIDSFGENQTTYDLFVGNVATPGTLAFTAVAAAAFNGNGACFGMALASQHMAHNPGLINAGNGLMPGAPATVWNLTATGNLVNYIERTHLHQLSSELISYTAAWQLAGHTSTGIYNQLRNLLLQGDRPLISMQESVGDGHVVVAYDLEMALDTPDPNDYYIDVYDPNRPYMNDSEYTPDVHLAKLAASRIHVLSDNRWLFKAGNNWWEGGFSNFMVIPYGVVPQNPTFPGQLPDPSDLILGSGLSGSNLSGFGSSITTVTARNYVTVSQVSNPLDPVMLNPQPLPPRESVVSSTSVANRVSLNPQPLPPREFNLMVKDLAFARYF